MAKLAKSPWKSLVHGLRNFMHIHDDAWPPLPSCGCCHLGARHEKPRCARAHTHTHRAICSAQGAAQPARYFSTHATSLLLLLLKNHGNQVGVFNTPAPHPPACRLQSAVSECSELIWMKGTKPESRFFLADLGGKAPAWRVQIERPIKETMCGTIVE